MKKKIIIIGIIILIIGIILSFKIFKENYSIITLDINPSIELKVNRKDIVVKTTALNEDSNELISDNLKNKNIDEVLTSISNEIIDKINNEDKEYIILLHVEGKLETDKVSEKKTKYLTKEINQLILLFL